MRAVVDEARDVGLRHLGELRLVEVFEASEDDGTGLAAVVVDGVEGDELLALFDGGGL